ncbi:hypothetical protein C8R47DRAFT_1194014 [Mycena vitilis]|nr:hypothetical protein C8R47DRAFT_1194014 [Mycena vitilis]
MGSNTTVRQCVRTRAHPAPARWRQEHMQLPAVAPYRRQSPTGCPPQQYRARRCCTGGSNANVPQRPRTRADRAPAHHTSGNARTLTQSPLPSPIPMTLHDSGGMLVLRPAGRLARQLRPVATWPLYLCLHSSAPYGTVGPSTLQLLRRTASTRAGLRPACSGRRQDGEVMGRERKQGYPTAASTADATTLVLIDVVGAKNTASRELSHAYGQLASFGSLEPAKLGFRRPPGAETRTAVAGSFFQR